MGVKYIDPSQGINGSGTITNPYNSFTELNALSGDQSWDEWRIKAGTSIRESVILAGVSNLFIGMYGDGDKPKIYGSDIITTTWTQEGSLFYLPSITEKQAVFCNSVELIDVATKVELADNNIWYDSGNSRLYAVLDGTNINTTQVEKNNSTRGNPVVFSTCSDLVVTNLYVLHGHDNNIKGTAGNGNNIKVMYNQSDYSGGWAATGRDGIVLYGDDITPATGYVVRGNVCNYNQNNAIEVWGLDAPIIEDNYGEDGCNGIELWGYISNAEVRRNTILRSIRRGTSNGHQNGIWQTADNNNNNTCSYNLLVDSFARQIDIYDGTGTVVNNNTLIQATSSTIELLELLAGDVDWNNNILYINNTGNVFHTSSGTTLTGDNNIFYRPTAFNAVFGGSVVNFSSYQAAATPTDANSTYIDPDFADTTYRLNNTALGDATDSPCLNAGASLGYIQDVEQKTIYGNPDIGALESKVKLDVSGTITN